MNFRVNSYALLAESKAKVLIGEIVQMPTLTDKGMFRVQRLDDDLKPVGSPFTVHGDSLEAVPITLKNFPKSLDECAQRGKNNVWISACILAAPMDGHVNVRLGDGTVVRLPADLPCGWTHEENRPSQ